MQKWNGKSIPDLGDLHLIQILRWLQKLAELKRRSIKLALCLMLEDCPSGIKPVIEGWKNEVHEQSWEEFTEPVFVHLLGEAFKRKIVWNIGLDLDEEIDISMRGPLERQIVGAIRDSVNAHGPITKETAPSAAKRVIGAIKTFNRKVKRDAG